MLRKEEESSLRMRSESSNMRNARRSKLKAAEGEN